jgi:hypothetical protein
VMNGISAASRRFFASAKAFLIRLMPMVDQRLHH